MNCHSTYHITISLCILSSIFLLIIHSQIAETLDSSDRSWKRLKRELKLKDEEGNSTVGVVKRERNRKDVEADQTQEQMKRLKQEQEKCQEMEFNQTDLNYNLDNGEIFSKQFLTSHVTFPDTNNSWVDDLKIDFIIRSKEEGDKNEECIVQH